MKLYEILNELDELFDLMGSDELTDEERQAANARFSELMEKKTDILEWLAKSVMNDRALAAGCKEEGTRLIEKAKKAEASAERKLKVLERECGEGKTQLGNLTLSSRAGVPKAVYLSDDEPSIAEWCREHNLDSCVRTKTTVSLVKDELKKAVGLGYEIPGVNVVRETSWSLK